MATLHTHSQQSIGEDEKGKSIPDNAQRAMAGNSIVVDVLYHIFRKLYVDTGCEPNQQIKLF